MSDRNIGEFGPEPTRVNETLNPQLGWRQGLDAQGIA
jgi:hypothetical protein